MPEGPDAVVSGWDYNLGRSGLRVELVAEAPTHWVVRHVFESSSAAGRVEVGDHIVGVAGGRFAKPHCNGYGMDVFGPQGPLLDLANALEARQSKVGEGRLELLLERNGRPLSVTLAIGTRDGEFAPSYPAECRKSERVLAELLEYLLAAQRDDGSFGDSVVDTFASLALLTSGERKHLAAVERSARHHAHTTKAVDQDSLINWRYMTAAIVLSEYHARTRESWVVRELEECATSSCRRSTCRSRR